VLVEALAVLVVVELVELKRFQQVLEQSILVLVAAAVLEQGH
jgi:hypothetical protein